MPNKPDGCRLLPTYPIHSVESSELPTVTAEVASSSLVVPAILFKELVFISAKPLRTQKGRAARPCRVPFALFPPCHVATASCVAAPKDSGASEEKTND